LLPLSSLPHATKDAVETTIAARILVPVRLERIVMGPPNRHATLPHHRRASVVTDSPRFTRMANNLIF
jgi:hypothetical protein